MQNWTVRAGRRRRGGHDALVFPEVSRKKQRPESGRPKTGSFYRNLRKVKGVWRVFLTFVSLQQALPKWRGWQRRVRNCDQVSGSSGRVRDSGRPLLAGLVWGGP